jgi:hypothetical protein
MDDPLLERPAKREVDDRFLGAGAVLQIACECGRSTCAADRVLRLGDAVPRVR